MKYLEGNLVEGKICLEGNLFLICFYFFMTGWDQTWFNLLEKGGGLTLSEHNADRSIFEQKSKVSTYVWREVRMVW